MAIDTAVKRASVIALGLPSGRVLPWGDGTIDADDRLHIAGWYRGIDAALPPPVRIIVVGRDLARLAVNGSESLALAVPGRDRARMNVYGASDGLVETTGMDRARIEVGGIDA